MIDSSNPALANVIFSSNLGGWGGRICTAYSSPTLSQVMFVGNLGGYGGGMAASFDSNPTLIDVSFIQNTGGEVVAEWPISAAAPH